ncbi:unnamed protein product [Spirodela intermedia]|uniref:Uncharacterized protein n=1 Tax=Spirodela intermedia TaxID=51605 RepID=A0A7I8IN91_SPIIN|nr:unnamed protein product [Spirodela intermedia]CAA6659278.1 unnamed protein product [Spirodela intermedia]
MVENSRKVKDYNSSEAGVKRKSKRNLKTKKGLLGSGDKDHSSSSEPKKTRNIKDAYPKGHVVVEDHHSKKSQKVCTTDVQALESVRGQGLTASATSVLRKKVNPELANYFYQIANLFESNSIDLEEKPVVCGSALEETRGEELGLATDVVLSHTLQILLEGCDFGALCRFLLSSADVFSHIATDKCGSHVAETALKSLFAHLEDPDARSAIEDTLRKICEAVVVDSASVMSSPYGSHVLRSLICLCKGVAVDSLEEYHVTKSSSVLAERLNVKHSQSRGKNPYQSQHGFPDTFKFLVMEMLRQAEDEIATLCANKYSSFVMQTALKLLVGDEEGLLHVILLILGCSKERDPGDCLIDTADAPSILSMLEDTSSSHLLEVILEVAPENLYDEILTKVFRGSLAKIATHHCGNFVIQALLSSAKSQVQVDSIWEELHALFMQLLETGKSGVVASLLAACHRLQTHGQECCQTLANAVCSGSDFPSAIVPRMLFLERYFSSKVSSWEWPSGEKMHVVGCLILQVIFRFPKKMIQPYIRSILSMDADHVVQTARDAGGGRVLEAFLCSDSSAQQKIKVIGKLQDCFGELSLNPCGSFTVEKCFDASDLSLKETIAWELLAVRTQLSKTKHGPFIIKKLDIDGLEARPEQWTRRQANKEHTYREFQAAFGSDKEIQEGDSHSSAKKKHRRPREQMVAQEGGGGGNGDDARRLSTCEASEFPGLGTSLAKLGFPDAKKDLKRKRPAGLVEGGGGKTFKKNIVDIGSGKERSLTAPASLADYASKEQLTAGEVRSLFQGSMQRESRLPSAEKKKKIPFLRQQRH